MCSRIQRNSSGGGSPHTETQRHKDSKTEDATEETQGVSAMRTSLSNYQLTRNKSKMIIVPPVRFDDYDCLEEKVAFAMFVSGTMSTEVPL